MVLVKMEVVMTKQITKGKRIIKIILFIFFTLFSTTTIAHEWKNPLLCVSAKSPFEDKIYMVCEEAEKVTDKEKCYSDKVGCSKPLNIGGKIVCEVECEDLP